MKKHLIAAAVAAAVAVPAAAQVTVYGVLDHSFGQYGDTAAGTISAVQHQVWASSRLGFRGSEDLGGGLKAGFVLESGITTDTAEAFTLGSRGMELFVEGGFGQVRLGKAAGSDINTVVSGPFHNMANFTAITATRPANRVQYITPKFSGFQANLAYATNADDEETTAAATKETGAYTSIGVRYDNGPLSVLIARAVEDTVVSSVTTEQEDTGLMVRYNLGIADLAVRYLRSDQPGTTADIKTTAFDVKVPLGKSVNGYLAHVRYDTETTDADFKRLIVGADYALSKRTAAYVAYGSLSADASAAATSAFGSSGSIKSVPGQDQDIFAIGVRHSF
jgi:predicted porin